MKRILKWTAITLLGVVILLLIVGLIAHQPLPEGQQGAEADHLAKKMELAIDKVAWDSTRWVRWGFANRHDFVWDRANGLVEVRWGENQVLLRTQDQSGKAYQNGQQVEGEEAVDLLNKAWFYFCNDSFWLNAPAKVFDPGTSRAIVELEDGNQGLLVSYASGGVTPGDAYLWMLDENGLPKSWKMWVSIIPVGGLEFSWENWTTLSTGAKLSTQHKGLLTIPLTDVQAGQHYTNIGLKKNPFSGL